MSRKSLGPKFNLKGKRFGKWRVLAWCGPNKSSKWLCRCDCGREVLVAGATLRNGRSTKCARCNDHNLLSHLRHGLARSPVYNTWSHMIRRCHNSKDASYKNYGARGISVCQEWRDSFEAFYAYMGDKPDGKSIDRINNNGNYEPGNVRWATPAQQCRNTRRTKRLKYNGQIVALSDVADSVGLSAGVLRARISTDRWTEQDAIATPKLERKRKEVAHRGRDILTPKDVLVIRSSKERSTSLAKRYGVSRFTIWDVRTGRTWKDVR